jgi:hypothetical protein
MPVAVPTERQGAVQPRSPRSPQQSLLLRHATAGAGCRCQGHSHRLHHPRLPQPGRLHRLLATHQDSPTHSLGADGLSLVLLLRGVNRRPPCPPTVGVLKHFQARELGGWTAGLVASWPAAATGRAACRGPASTPALQSSMRSERPTQGRREAQMTHWQGRGARQSSSSPPCAAGAPPALQLWRRSHTCHSVRQRSAEADLGRRCGRWCQVPPPQPPRRLPLCLWWSSFAGARPRPRAAHPTAAAGSPRARLPVQCAGWGPAGAERAQAAPLLPCCSRQGCRYRLDGGRRSWQRQGHQLQECRHLPA